MHMYSSSLAGRRGHLEGKEDRGAQKQRGLSHSLGGVRLGRAFAGRVPQQRHPQVQRDVVGCRDLIRPCMQREVLNDMVTGGTAALSEAFSQERNA